MGEIAVSTAAADELTALGLGSCIGLAIVDRSAGVAGLAHIVLPESNGEAAESPGKYADIAVPALLDRMHQAGAADHRMEVALVGGARMFEMSSGLDIGARNERAVRDALAAASLRPAAVQTGGNQGRTVRVSVGAGRIAMRVAGQPAVTLVDGPAHSGSRAGCRASGEPTVRRATSRPGRAGGPRSRSNHGAGRAS